jgi:hypothetical protein
LLDNFIPDGTDTLYWRNDGTNFAYLNGLIIVGYRH